MHRARDDARDDAKMRWAENSTSTVARLARSPHTLTMLACGAVALAVATHAFANDANDARWTTEDGIRRGATGALGAYLAYGALQGPATHMTRPHAAVWKVVHAAFTMYLLALIVLLFQTPADAQKMLKFFWDDLGTPQPTRSYGGDCRVYTPGHRSGSFGIVYETLFDEFTVAHVLGWFGKAVAIRDWGLLWAYSIAFELCELTFEHWQPNFNECWWDMWVWDVMICNLLGICAGMWLVKFMRGKFHDWSGKKASSRSAAAKEPPRSPVRGALKTVLTSLTPASVDYYTWRPTGSPSRFLKCAFLVFCGLVFDLNLFFMKFVLHVPPSHNFCLYRLGLWFAMSNIAIREYYVFIETPDVGEAKLGPNAWLALAVLIVEFLVVVKNGRGKFTAPWPRHVVIAWIVAVTTTAAYLISWQRKLNAAAERERDAELSPLEGSTRESKARAPARKSSSKKERAPNARSARPTRQSA